MASTSTDRPTVAIAGATGFVGTAVREALAEEYRIIGLTRSPIRARANADADAPETWRHCDLFSPHEVRAALKGADYAIYLVHSLLPSSRLTQGTPADLDLMMADNFARAAAAQGVKQILYIGGLIPDDAPASSQVVRRLEVERALQSGEVPCTSLRAGLIVGPGGTRLQMLLNLVRRLPVMVLPDWAKAQTQPIALSDVIRALKRCLGQPEAYRGPFDIGGPEVMTYRTMMNRAARELGLTRYMIDTPVSAPRISKLWVQLFGGAPRGLVDPIVESLRHNATVEPNPLHEWLQAEALPFEEALRRSVDASGRSLPNPRQNLRDEEDALIRAASVVRSVQRLPLPPGFSARDVAKEYMDWLPRFGWPLLNCTIDGPIVRFKLKGLGLTLLELTYAETRSLNERELFHVTGGLLADMTNAHEGRLEFRTVLGGRYAMAAVHDFAPTLPWYMYNATQALAHLWVMNRFGHHLDVLRRKRLAEADPSAADTTQPALQQ